LDVTGSFFVGMVFKSAAALAKADGGGGNLPAAALAKAD